MSTATANGLAGLEFVNRDLHRQLRESHAENMDLRDRLAKLGVHEPAPSGVVTLARLRALEDVMNLAYLYLRDHSAERGAELRAAITLAGRAP